MIRTLLSKLLSWWTGEEVFLKSELSKAVSSVSPWTEKQLEILVAAEKTINSTMTWFNNRLSDLEDRLDAIKVTATVTGIPNTENSTELPRGQNAGK